MAVRNLLARIFGSKPTEMPRRGASKFHRPGGTQRDICERLGVPIPTNMDRRGVHALIQESIRDPAKKSLLEQYEAEQKAKEERDERKELGDELFEIVKRWEAISDAGGYFLVRFKRSQTEHLDVVEFDRLDVDPSRMRSPVKICLLLPKRRTERDTGTYLEWEREVCLTPEQITYCEKLPQYLDSIDIESYEAILAKVKIG